MNLLGMGHHYKHTELGLIPSEWDVNNLGAVTDLITDGSHFSPTPIDESDYRICTVANMELTGFNYEAATSISYEDYEKLVKSKCKPELGDVLLSKDGTVGKTLLFNQKNENIVLLSSIAILRTDRRYLYPGFLKHYLSSEETLQRLTDMKTGSAIKRIVLNNIKTLMLPIPPLHEQQKIADILSTVDEQIEHTDALIEKTKELKKGLMQQLLTRGIGHTKFKQTELGEIPEEWKVISLFETGEYINGRAFKPCEWEKKGIPIIRIQNLTDKSVEFNYCSIPIENKYHVADGDLLLSWSGSIGLYIWNRGEAYLNQHIYKVLPGPNIDKGYLYFQLQQQITQLTELSHGSTMKHITRKNLELVKVPIPSLEEQRQVSEILNYLERMITEHQLAMDNLYMLKKGLMQKLLTGQIRVKVS